MSTSCQICVAIIEPYRQRDSYGKGVSIGFELLGTVDRVDLWHTLRKGRTR